MKSLRQLSAGLPRRPPCKVPGSIGNAVSLPDKASSNRTGTRAGCSCWVLTFHRQLLHGSALSTGAVRRQRVALDAAASAHAAAQHVVGVQVVSALGERWGVRKGRPGQPWSPPRTSWGSHSRPSMSLTANRSGHPQSSRVPPMSSRVSPLPSGSALAALGSPQVPLDLP